MITRNPLFISKNFFEILPAELDANYIETRNGIYEGQIVHNKRQGKGIYIWDDSSVYVGDWINDQPHGEGIIFLCNGCYIYGQFECGKLNGKCVIKFANDSRIFGQWRQNQLKGISFFYDNEKKEWRMYEFKQGLLFRVLEVQEYSSFQYQSQFFSNNHTSDYISNTDIPIPLFPQFSRRDIELFSLNNILMRFTHSMQNNSIGQKTLSYMKLSEDLSYFGLIQNDMPEGLGITIQDNILKNIGNFKQAIMQGLGRVYSENGLIFDGNFDKGHLNGLGYLYNSETDIFYEGLFYENECNKLFKKQNGFQLDSIIKHRQNQHKQASSFNNQLLVVDIAQTILGNISLIQLSPNNRKMSAHNYNNNSIDEINNFLESDNNPFFYLIQKNKEYIQKKRQNLFYYPHQSMNKYLFNASNGQQNQSNMLNNTQQGMRQNFQQNNKQNSMSLRSSQQGMYQNQYKYEEYEFSLHEFQKQLERPTLKSTLNNQTILESDIKINEQDDEFNYNIQKYQQSPPLKQQQSPPLKQQQQQEQNIINSKRQSPSPQQQQLQQQFGKTINSITSQRTEYDSPLIMNKTPPNNNNNRKSPFNQNTIERKLDFSNILGSHQNSNQQLQTRNPYFQLMPQQSNDNSDTGGGGVRTSINQQNNQNSNGSNNYNTKSQSSPFTNNNNITTKKQGNWLYEQIRGRNNTPKPTNRNENNNDGIRINNNSINNNYNNNNSINYNNNNNSINNNTTQSKSPLRTSNNNNTNVFSNQLQQKTQQYSSLQNQFKSQLNMTNTNTSNYSTSRNNFQELRNSLNQTPPKSKIFNRPKSSLNRLSMNTTQNNSNYNIKLSNQNQNQNLNQSQNQNQSQNLKKRSISPYQQQNYMNNDNNSKSQNNFNLTSNTIKNNNHNSSSNNSRIFRNNNSNININNNVNKLKKSESPIPRFKQQSPSPQLQQQIKTKVNVKSKKENIKQVHLRLPSSFFN